MAPENGNYVTRAELKAHLEPMRSDIGEIHDDVKTLLLAHAGETAIETRVKDTGARKLALAGLGIYLISMVTGILTLAVAHL